MQNTIKIRLEELRAALRAENISYGELFELQSLAPHIDSSDVELLEAAGVEEKNLMQITIKLPNTSVTTKDGAKLGTGADVILKLSRWQFTKFALSILWHSIAPTYETKQALLAWRLETKERRR